MNEIIKYHQILNNIYIENKGDICFNFDGISFEFYVTNNTI